MEFQALLGIAVPFLGTALGAGTVFFLKKISDAFSSVLGGFAGGVMSAASVWSLIIPAIEWSGGLGVFAFLPAAVGFALGIFLFVVLDGIVPCISSRRGCGRTMLTLAVTVHNIPEGVAVGVVYAGLLSGIGAVSAASAFMLALGVGIQNFPEGAIISLPAAASGVSRGKSFFLGIVSALAESAGAVLALALSSIFLPALPYLLGFAAGAMIYVVVSELIPEAALGAKTRHATIAFSAGFLLMMALDVALG